ncbi:MAG: hypothetical protein ACYCQK_02055 [Acidiferrobacteraceae bacterium]
MATYTLTSGKVTLTAAATKTLLLYNPNVARAILRDFTISLDASTAAAGVQFDLYRVSTLGTPAGTAATSNLTDEQDSADPNTGHLIALTTEPTSVSVIDSVFLQPLGGAIKDWQPFGVELLKTKIAGARIGIRYTTASGVTPDALASAYIDI